jgi:SAM-dependent methyltransferase
MIGLAVLVVAAAALAGWFGIAWRGGGLAAWYEGPAEQPWALAGAGEDGTDKGETKPAREPDMPYAATPPEIVDRMLELAEAKKGDVVYDLGCGDGRIVIAAAKQYGARGVGFDLNPALVRRARANARRAGVGDRVTIEQADIFELDLSGADVITLYLMPDLNVRLIPQLEKLKPGARIVSHQWDMKGVKPRKVIHFTARNGSERTVYLWVTPLEKE